VKLAAIACNDAARVAHDLDALDVALELRSERVE
jgi:hypothetical protein